MRRWGRTVYSKEPTVIELEQTLNELGAVRVHKNLDGWGWRFPASGETAVEIQVLEDVDSWQMELTIEKLNKWREPFAGLGWEPTIAVMLQCDERPEAVASTRRLVEQILRSHQGVADVE